MKKTERILRPAARIHGGTSLPHYKGTAELQTVLMPPPAEVRIPMSQHIGAPAQPVVKVGDKVFVGTLIGEAGGFVSAPVHASVSGTVKAIVDTPEKSVVIESDGAMEPDPNLKPFPVKSKEDIATAANLCGLVGLGGAGFPTRVKLTVKEGTAIDTLIINGAECEPYITSDYRECMENDDLIKGVYLLKEVLGVDRVIICIESNKPKAIEKLYAIATDKRDSDDTVKLMKLPTSYPQGAEKVLIYSATGRRVPVGKLPSDVGCIVMNITSVAALYRFITTGMPLVSKRVTIDGTAVNEPKNIIAPIGTPIREILEFAGGVTEDAAEIIMGGPMMGIDIFDENAVLEKRNNAITVMRETIPANTTPCIHCDRCASACPMNLYPALVDAALNRGLTENLNRLNVFSCMECGSCSFVCPAKRPLAQAMRLAKAELKKEATK
ncbi:MAG: electron transport complex subunit RsxC [Clostridia bacterium]|nr:electron transport complex subunit RsxC [Clostridia bacterium]